ncbi:hypothetical protein HY091_01085 [Candidatus Kaiserbacteria bacterium]|nr:hypothetical protein [Candidatus Kaiserbacteria bacterium]
MTPKSAVLIHGLHLEANGWESLVWGDPEHGTYGTIPRGILEAWKTSAHLIYWGTGASERDGKKEAEWMYDRAILGIAQLATLCGTDVESLQSFLKDQSVKDTEAKDTNTEIRACYDVCIERGIDQLTLIPYASQAPLAARRALWMALEDEKYSSFKHKITIAPSDTRYVGVSMQDIVIFTPPHRGDRIANPSHTLARRTLDVIQHYSKASDKEGVANFLAEWDALLKKFEK